MVGWIAVAALAVSSQVTDVTVYNDRAQVVRTAQVELLQGMNQLRFEDLPESVDSRGIQVNGAGAATVLDVRFKTENYEVIPEERWKALYDRRDELNDEQKTVQDRLQRLIDQKAFLSNIATGITRPSDKEAAEMDPGKWDRMLQLYVTKGAEYDDAIMTAEKELRVIGAKLEKVSADIQEAGADRRKQRRVVEIDLDAQQAGSAEIALSYMVHGPGWKPVYDVRVDTESRKMEVRYFGLVRQNTGEDWSSVALKLSTANPGLGGKHPDIEPWRIGVKRPHMAVDDRLYEDVDFDGLSISGMEQGLDWSRMRIMDNDFPVVLNEPAPVEVRYAAVKEQGASVLFEVKGTSTVESDNVEHRVAVTSVSLPAHFRYSAVPKMDKHAYLKARAVNRSNSPFLAGKANIFLDGSYVATSSMELVAPDEDFWVFLGTDESMKVEYKLIQDYTSREGLRNRTVRHTYEYLLTVENTHAVSEEVIVWDQIPVSMYEAVEVDLIRPRYSEDTDALKIDEEKRIQWFRTLEPGQKWEIPLEFRVDAPVGVNITGLE
ncbi:MAG: mucoidy inhibitor MuiA family protein [Pontiellaceae bacterium]|nr:mucoidy inhibitor MuiA family protein [Pontiellaceae bacterium]MBN2783818.1 mucoidy inhibitor MuiA family protein [Pontiellaceae bacterium]